MKATDVLSTGIPGLDLVLGGGVACFRRNAQSDRAAVVVLRGGPGAGKSVLGSFLAQQFAKQLERDLVVACAGVHPTEIIRQWEGLPWLKTERPLLMAPYPKATVGSEARVFLSSVELLDKDSNRRPPRESFFKLLTSVTGAGGVPGVVVLDALSDGYGTGATAPREWADELCQLAVDRGLLLVIVEEVAAPGPSPWVFAADVVLELLQTDAGLGGELPLDGDRSLRVLKNRYGPAVPGPHPMELMPRPQVYPRPESHLNAALAAVAPELRGPKRANWGPPELSLAPTDWRAPKHSTIAVYGAHSGDVLRVGRRLVQPRDDPGGWTFFVDLSEVAGPWVNVEGPDQRETVFAWGNPALGGSRALWSILQRWKELHDADPDVHLKTLWIGDFSALQNREGRDSLLHAVGVLTALLRIWGVPVILFETVTAIDGRGDDRVIPAMLPQVASRANVLAEVRKGAQGVEVVITQRPTGKTATVRVPGV